MCTVNLTDRHKNEHKGVYISMRNTLPKKKAISEMQCMLVHYALLINGSSYVNVTMLHLGHWSKHMARTREWGDDGTEALGGRGKVPTQAGRTVLWDFLPLHDAICYPFFTNTVPILSTYYNDLLCKNYTVPKSPVPQNGRVITLPLQLEHQHWPKEPEAIKPAWISNQRFRISVPGHSCENE